MVISVSPTSGQTLTDSEADLLSTVTFYVHWYDVGKSALEGLDGVKQVIRNYKKFKEINTVYYDPQLITIAQMIKALKGAGTFRGLAQ